MHTLAVLLGLALVGLISASASATGSSLLVPCAYGTSPAGLNGYGIGISPALSAAAGEVPHSTVT